MPLVLSVDAGLDGRGERAGRFYLFAGGDFYEYGPDLSRPNVGYPGQLDEWGLPTGFLGGIDAALNGQGAYEGKAFFFRGSEYVRWDWETGVPDPGYPADIAQWGFPAGFGPPIDAAFNGHGESEGKAYLVSGGQYMQLDWETDTYDEGFPADLSAFPFGALLGGALDAALDVDTAWSGNLFVFRGPGYCRYDWNAGTIASAGVLAEWQLDLHGLEFPHPGDDVPVA